MLKLNLRPGASTYMTSKFFFGLGVCPIGRLSLYLHKRFDATLLCVALSAMQEAPRTESARKIAKKNLPPIISCVGNRSG